MSPNYNLDFASPSPIHTMPNSSLKITSTVKLASGRRTLINRILLIMSRTPYARGWLGCLSKLHRQRVMSRCLQSRVPVKHIPTPGRRNIINIRESLIDTAQVYKNEAHVGAAVRECASKREDIFISVFYARKLVSSTL